MSFKRVLNIIFYREPNDRIDLFKVFPRLKQFFKRRRLHLFIRTIGDLVFAFIILVGLFGPQDPDRNCILFLSWGLWWPTVVLSWFFVGRMWCGFCPFPGAGRIVQRLGLTLNLPIPPALRRYGIHWSVALLALIIWIEESTGIKESPRETALLLLAILAGATFSAVFFPKQAWCRYLCPMGRLIGVASTLSLTEFRPDHEKCRTCKTFACKRGAEGIPGCPVYLGAFNVRNNLDCLVCGHCIELCDKDSPQLNLRNPFTELITNKGRFITCSYIIPFLMGSQLTRFFEDGGLAIHARYASAWPGQMIIYSVVMVAGFLYAHSFIRLGANLFGITEDELFGKFSPMVPIFVPMAFAGELAYRLGYAFTSAQDFLPTVGRQFGIGLLEGLGFHVPTWTYPAIDLPIMTIGTIAGLFVLYEFVNEDFKGLVSNRRYRAIQVLILLMACSYLLLMGSTWQIDGCPG